MVSKKKTRKAVNAFRGITFPGTETRLGKPPGTFMVKEGEKVTDMTFPGTQGRLGKPKGFDQRKKARNRLSKFDVGDELM